jgi:chromosome segregation ATPase
MINYAKKIQELEDKIQANKDELIRLQEREKTLKEDETKVLQKLEELGIKAEDLEKVIEEKEKNLTQAIEKIENELN